MFALAWTLPTCVGHGVRQLLRRIREQKCLLHIRIQDPLAIERGNPQRSTGELRTSDPKGQRIDLALAANEDTSLCLCRRTASPGR